MTDLKKKKKEVLPKISNSNLYLEIIKLQTQVDRLNAFIGIDTLSNTKSTKLPTKLHNIRNKIQFDKVKLFFKEKLEINIDDYLVNSNKTHVVVIRHLFLYTLHHFCDMTPIEIQDVLKVQNYNKYDRGNIYYVIKRHDDYMVGFDSHSIVYKKYYNEINNNIRTYLIN